MKSKNALRRERRRERAALRKALATVASAAIENAALRRRLDRERENVAWYHEQLRELRHRKSSVLRGLIPVAEWPYTVSP